MSKRLITLAVMVALVGMVTHAFAAEQQSEHISRAGAVALLVESDDALKDRLQHFIDHRPPMPLFSDLNYNEWYAPYIETAFEAGLISGTANGRFEPGRNITEEEGITLGVRYAALNSGRIAKAISTASQGSWFNTYAQTALNEKMTLPFPIRLGQPMQRSDIYAFYSSIGISNPSAIAITYSGYVAPVEQNPAPVVAQVISQPTTTTSSRPVQNTNTPIRPITSTPPTTGTVSNNSPTVSTAPAPTSTASQKAFAISMPTLGIKDLTITHPTDPFTKDGLHAVLQQGVGHLFSYPGKGGNILVYGHSSSYPWDVSEYTKIFRQINKLNVGDMIEVTYNGTLYTYQVSHKQTVPADDMSVYQQNNGEELILYTCWPPDSIKERYLVHAKPVSQVAIK